MDEKDSDEAERVRRNFRESSREDVTVGMTEEGVRRSWGGLLRGTDCRAFGSYYFNPDVAWVDAGKAVEVMAAEAVKMGVRYEVGEVRRILLGKGNGVKGVETQDGRVYTAGKVLLCTGAWTSQVMSSLEDELNLPDEQRIESQITAAGVVVAHFQLSPDEKAIYDQLPIFVYGEQGQSYSSLLNYHLGYLPRICIRRSMASNRIRPPQIHSRLIFHKHHNHQNRSLNLRPSSGKPTIRPPKS